MGWRGNVTATAVTAVVLLGGYLVADAYDVVPGMLTTSPAPAAPAPFPSAPGATTGPDVERSLPGLPEDAPVPAAGQVGNLVGDLAKDDRLGKRVGVVVADARSGDLLGTAAPDRLMTPASVQKLLTATAALAGPGGDRTLPTTVVLSGDSDLVLVGGGDMMLAAGDGDEEAVNGHAGLGGLADQVAAKLLLSGRDSVTLAVDDTIFTGPAVAPSVPANDVRDGYVAPVASVGVDVARLTDAEYGPRAKDPALAAARMFADALADRGLTVRGRVTHQAAPSSAREIARVESAPLRDVVTYLLHHSDNTITEVVGRIVALDAGRPGSAQAARQAVRAQVADLGVDLERAELTDLSGLGRGSRMTPRQVADVLALALDPDNPELRAVARGLPVGGLSGTLADRYPQGNPGRGYVTGKTGSLPRTTTLAGTVVTADDRLLVYSLMADAVPKDQTYGARIIFDRFTGSLAACGCTP